MAMTMSKTQEQGSDREFLFKRLTNGKDMEKFTKVETLIYNLADQIILNIDTRRELNRTIEILRLYSRKQLKRKRQSQKRI